MQIPEMSLPGAVALAGFVFVVIAVILATRGYLRRQTRLMRDRRELAGGTAPRPAHDVALHWLLLLLLMTAVFGVGYLFAP